MVSNNKMVTIIIRASNEATVQNLYRHLSIQKDTDDVLIILDSAVSFERKMKEGFELALEYNNQYTVFIDGDILLRTKALKKIKMLIPKLEINDLGFGLRLWDKFYNRPKFRGLHVYKTSLLKKAFDFIPKEGFQLRPETYVKDQMKLVGHYWRNDISNYIIGIHDFYQYPADIYYKFLIRSKRSQKDVDSLRKYFLKNITEQDFQIAYRGLKDGEKLNYIYNDKSLYFLPEDIKFSSEKTRDQTSYMVDILIYKKLVADWSYRGLRKMELIRENL